MTDSSDSLAPSVDATKEAFTQSFAAYQPVSIYATALEMVAADLRALPEPDWFGSIANTIEAADTHANSWLVDLGPQATTGVTQMLIDYNGTFQSQTDVLQNLLAQIPDTGPTPDQQAQVNSQLDALVKASTAMQTKVEQLDAKLKELAGHFEDDHKALSDAETSIDHHVHQGHVVIDKMQATMGDDFLEAHCDGPLSVQVHLNADIEVKLRGQAGDTPQLMPYVIAGAEIGHMLDDLAAATTAMSGVLTVWQTITVKLAAITEDLRQAKDDAYTSLLASLDIQTAQMGWQQMATFAMGLQREWSAAPATV